MTKLIVHHKGQTREFTIAAHTNILGFLIRQALEVPWSCRAGRCGSCKAKLLRGRVKMEQSDGLGRDEISQGYILLCQASPESKTLELRIGDCTPPTDCT